MKKIILLLAVVMMTSFAYADTPLIQNGSFNDNTIALQNKLSELGLFTANPAGPFNAAGEEALKTLQTAIGWEATGLIYGQDELDSILAIESSLGNILHNAGEPQIGKKSSYTEGIWRSASGGEGTREIVEVKDIDGVKSGIHLTGTAEAEKHTSVGIDKVPVIYGVKYTLSCYAKGSGKLIIMHGKKPYPRKDFDVSSDWQLYTATFTLGYKDGSNSITNVYFGVPKGENSDVVICGMKLEADISSLALNRNILNNSGSPQIGKSDYENGVWKSASAGKAVREIVDITDAPTEGITAGIHILGTADETSNSNVAIVSVPVVFGEKYVLSCYAKGSGKLNILEGKKPYQRKSYKITDEWQQYSLEFTAGEEDGCTEEDPTTNIFFGIPKGVDSDVVICGMSLVRE